MNSTIHTDSIGQASSQFTTFLINPLRNVTSVSIMTANFSAPASGSNVAYLYVDELRSPNNDATGTVDPSVNGISGKNILRWAIALFNVTQNNRTVYTISGDYPTVTAFNSPIGSLDRLSIQLLDETGNVLTTDSNTFITFSFTSTAPPRPATARPALMQQQQQRPVQLIKMPVNRNGGHRH